MTGWFLPDPFMSSDETRISSVSEWPQQRKWLLDMLDRMMYGIAPQHKYGVSSTPKTTHYTAAKSATSYATTTGKQSSTSPSTTTPTTTLTRENIHDDNPPLERNWQTPPSRD